MGRIDDVFSNFSERITIGTGGTYQVKAVAGQLAINMKLVTGGTLEIGGISQTAGTMYFLSANEVLSQNMSGEFYLYATGATCIVALIRGKSQGT